MEENKNVGVLIPTLNGGEMWIKVLDSIKMQSFKIHRKIIIDSGSTDSTVHLAKEYGFEVVNIDKKDFNHGGTRQQLVDLCDDCEFCVFLTQDAILASPNSVENLIKVFLSDREIGMAYGRQLPHDNATPLEKHARLFNYPETSEIRCLADKDKFGSKIYFCSNSFASYRKSSLRSIGGFPSDSIMGDDFIVAAKMLLAGFKLGYIAESTVYHSHNYTLKEVFRRYFDIRIFHEQNKFLYENFGKSTGEGLKFVKSELNYSVRNYPLCLARSIFSIMAKWMGYTLAKYYKNIPVKILGKMSMHRFYWTSYS